MNEIQSAILKTIDRVVQDNLKRLGYNYYVDGKVTAVSGDTYTVVCGNNTYVNIPARTGRNFVVNDLVQVCVKNGDTSRKFIDDYRLI